MRCVFAANLLVAQLHHAVQVLERFLLGSLCATQLFNKISLDTFELFDLRVHLLNSHRLALLLQLKLLSYVFSLRLLIHLLLC